MPKIQIQTSDSAAPLGAYSQGIKAGDFIFITGNAPINPATGTITATTVAAQTEQIITNISNVLAVAGASLDDVVKSTVHLLDSATYPEFNKVYERMFPAPYPVRTTVGSDMRQVPGMLVEIDCIAYVGD